MTREEAIKKINAIKKYLTSGNPIWDVREIDEAIDMAIEALDERKVELFDDGTLVVNVKEGEKVGRVLIEGDDHFGGLYYIDAEPVKHGKWIEAEWVDLNDWTTWRKCSCCGESLSKYVEGFGRRDFPQMNYCPNCGAKMKG